MDAFHGTSRENAKIILKTRKWKITEDKDWLGNGVYFMEGSKQWACIWAEKGKHKYTNPYVLEASIEVEEGEIFNLAYDKWYHFFQIAHRRLKEEYPRSHIGDGAAINLACKMLEKGIGKSVEPVIIKVVKAFVPFENKKNLKREGKIPPQQIQIAVREKGLDSIKLKEEMLPCKKNS